MRAARRCVRHPGVDLASLTGHAGPPVPPGLAHAVRPSQGSGWAQPATIVPGGEHARPGAPTPPGLQGLPPPGHAERASLTNVLPQGLARGQSAAGAAPVARRGARTRRVATACSAVPPLSPARVLRPRLCRPRALSSPGARAAGLSQPDAQVGGRTRISLGERRTAGEQARNQQDDEVSNGHGRSSRFLCRSARPKNARHASVVMSVRHSLAHTGIAQRPVVVVGHRSASRQRRGARPAVTRSSPRGSSRHQPFVGQAHLPHPAVGAVADHQLGLGDIDSDVSRGTECGSPCSYSCSQHRGLATCGTPLSR